MSPSKVIRQAWPAERRAFAILIVGAIAIAFMAEPSRNAIFNFLLLLGQGASYIYN